MKHLQFQFPVVSNKITAEFLKRSSNILFSWSFLRFNIAFSGAASFCYLFSIHIFSSAPCNGIKKLCLH